MKLFKNIINVITILCVVIMILLWILPFLGFQSYSILSGSMEPVLQVGDIVIINTNSKDVEVNDIIAFNLGEAVVVHRVNQITDDGIITKGDANGSADGGARQTSDVIGKYVCDLGLFSIVYNFFSGIYKWILIVVLIVLNLFI